MREIALAFLKIGVTAYGGLAAICAKACSVRARSANQYSVSAACRLAAAPWSSREAVIAEKIADQTPPGPTECAC